MLPFNPLKSVREQNISVADWGSRVDPGVGQAQLRPMKPISGRHAAVPKNSPPTTSPAPMSTHRVTERYEVETIPNADENFASWIRDIGTPDQGTPFSPTMAVYETGSNQVRVPNPPSIPVPIVDSVTHPAVVPDDEVVDTTFHSVNSAEHRLDAAYFHLRTMDLPSDASWPQIMARYQEIMATLHIGPLSLPGRAAEVVRKRRAVNTAYACLRLLAVRQT